MKIKEQIENLKDIRRNLWISVIAIVGAVSTYTMGVKVFYFSIIVFCKAFISFLGLFIAFIFVLEVISCNKKINKLINNIKEN
ncbi:MAG TPA: hypothetical protein P5556_03915 [Candidatus Gastranaerophilales bacterium]|nr:hypothetical protein [Candidatus Gastranaerophilales bacterium]